MLPNNKKGNRTTQKAPGRRHRCSDYFGYLCKMV